MYLISKTDVLSLLFDYVSDNPNKWPDGWQQHKYAIAKNIGKPLLPNINLYMIFLYNCTPKFPSDDNYTIITINQEMDNDFYLLNARQKK